MHDNIRIIIMAKAPVEGRVKTRLMSRYTAAEAAAIYRDMATLVIERAMRMFSDIWLATDDPGHAFFRNFALPCREQGEGNLGARMMRLMRESFRQDDRAVMFLGCDSPHMPDVRLLQAVAALRNYDVVIGPVEDGGYDLIALKHNFSALFTDITWGTASVLTDTRRQAAGLGLKYFELETGFDIDTPADLLRSGFVIAD